MKEEYFAEKLRYVRKFYQVNTVDHSQDLAFRLR